MLLNIELYKHYKGSFYYKLCEAMLEKDRDIRVVCYMDEHGNAYIREKSEFYGMATDTNGKPVRRFKRIEELKKV